ncbi:MAG: hypothetical protein WCG36_00240 [bacterium]
MTMKKQWVIPWLGALGLFVLTSLILTGCDSGTGDTSELDNYFANHPYVSDPRTGGSVVALTPASAELDTVGAQAVFAFNGGTAPYTWDVADASKGSVSGSGAQGVYTVIAVGANNVIAYDRDGHAAIATISGSAGGSSGAALSIGASPSTLASDGMLAVVTAAGGVPPYAWSLTDNSVGSFPDAPSGSTAVYKRLHSGDNAVSVTDSLGNKVSVVINQP